MSLPRVKCASAPPDAGFTLAEGLVAMMIFGIVAVSAIPAVLGTMRSTRAAAEQQVAAELSESALQNMQRVDPGVPGAACNPITVALAADNANNWSGPPTGVDLSQTDSLATPAGCTVATTKLASGAALTAAPSPLTGTATSTRNNVTFTTTRIVGTCVLVAAGCTKASTAPAGATPAYRFIAATTWRGAACRAECSFVTSATQAMAADEPILARVTPGAPLAVNDSGCVPAGSTSPLTLNAAANDVFTATKDTFTIGTAPSVGSATVASATGVVTFTPPSGFSGQTALRYKITNPTTGLTSLGTVTIRAGCA